MSEADSGEKTFEATDQRREEFRKQGRYARSKDAAGVAALGVLAMGLAPCPSSAAACPSAPSHSTGRR